MPGEIECHRLAPDSRGDPVAKGPSGRRKVRELSARIFLTMQYCFFSDVSRMMRKIIASTSFITIHITFPGKFCKR